jgi:hypothetical protein
MPSDRPVFEFPAPILRQTTGMKYHFMPVPTDVAESLMKSGTRRVIATINGEDENRAIHNTKDGEYFLVMGLSILRRMKAKLGDVVVASLVSDPEPDKIDLPDELVEALKMDKAASDRFNGMTPGMQRSVASYVTGVKRPDSRVRRAMEITYKMGSYTLHGDDQRPQD